MRLLSHAECLKRTSSVLASIADWEEELAGGSAKRRRLEEVARLRKLSVEDHLHQVLRGLAQAKENTLFARAVDPVVDGVPDYLQKVARPLHLGTIASRLKGSIGYYGTASTSMRVEYAYADLHQVVRNAEEYWGDKNGEIPALARKLEKRYDAVFEKFLEIRIGDAALSPLVMRATSVTDDSSQTGVGGSTVSLVMRHLRKESEDRQTEALRADRTQGRIPMQPHLEVLRSSLERLLVCEAVVDAVGALIKEDVNLANQDDVMEFDPYDLSSSTNWKLWYQLDAWSEMLKQSEAEEAAAAAAAAAAQQQQQLQQQQSQQAKQPSQAREEPEVEIIAAVDTPVTPLGGHTDDPLGGGGGGGGGGSGLAAAGQWEALVLPTAGADNESESDDDDEDFAAMKQMAAAAATTAAPVAPASAADADADVAATGTPAGLSSPVGAGGASAAAAAAGAGDKADEGDIAQRIETQRGVLQNMIQKTGFDTTVRDMNLVLNSWEKDDHGRIDRIDQTPGSLSNQKSGSSIVLTAPSPYVGIPPPSPLAPSNPAASVEHQLLSCPSPAVCNALLPSPGLPPSAAHPPVPKDLPLLFGSLPSPQQS
eukprot:Rhum_TRINITY_DN14689_c47_g1::Rhum_TRINITY_DN14689_c47_g1_i1::g.109995::m.109995